MAGTEGTPTGGSLTLVVEDGTGKTNANSYCTVAYADTYHATYTGSTDWAGATESAKTLALIKGTMYIDLKYGSRWKGFKAKGYGDDNEQALDWPQIGNYDVDGWPYDETVLPARLKQATCEAALRALLGDDLLGTVTATGTVQSESVTVGPISESKSYSGGKPYGYVYPKIDALVRPFIWDGGNVVRG
jgi:hypothetical protein